MSASGPARSKPTTGGPNSAAARASSTLAPGGWERMAVTISTTRRSGPAACSPAAVPSATADQHVVHRQPALEVQARRPAHLGVRDAVGGQVLDQLGRRAAQRAGSLEQGDRQVEVGEQLGLVAAADRRHHPRPCLGRRQWQADLGGQLDRGGRAQRTVQVLVQLRLGQRAQIGGTRRPPVHRRMIGVRRRPTRAVLVGVLAVALLGAMLAARPAGRGADPTIAAERAAVLHQEARDATTRLDALIDQLQAALDAGRRGSALVIDGDESPRADLAAAAAGVNAASDEAALAAAAAARVDGIAGSRGAPARTPAAGAVRHALSGHLGPVRRRRRGRGPFVARRQATDQTLARAGGRAGRARGRRPAGRAGRP